jgi:hypothetical protein
MFTANLILRTKWSVLMSESPRVTATRKLNSAGVRFLSGIALIACTLLAPPANAQINCSSGSSTKMACLIPNTVLAGAPGYNLSPANVNSPISNSFAFLTSDLGGEISQIPLASPASGIIFTIDPTLHVPVRKDESLGPILTQRAETIGRHKLYIAMTYQYFLLEDVDGLSLKGPLTAAFPLNLTTNTNPTTPDAFAVGNSRVDLKIHQYVGYVTFGLTDRIDVSAAIPVLRVDMRYTINEQIFTPTSFTAVPQTSNARQSTGLGDVVLAMKGTAWKGEHEGLAVGAEVRLPTGDAQNFLGSGTWGVKPFATFTRTGRFSPHANVGYEFNGNTVLVTGTNGGNGQLPDRLIYSGGADWGIFKHLTIAADVIAQWVKDSPRATIDQNVQVTVGNGSASSIFTLPEALHSVKGNYNRTDASGGLKWKPFGNLLISGNLLVKLDQGGLRERLAPLGGISYTF